MDKTSNGVHLAAIVTKAAENLLAEIKEPQSAIPLSAGKWSPRQVIGHLIDSASNNHQRFVRANFQGDLIFPGYPQEQWVDLHGYQDWTWVDLLELWTRYNLLIARLVDRIPPAVLFQKQDQHNFHQIAWKTVPEDQAVTLDYFIKDYIGHLNHHVRQILPGFELA